MGYPRDAVGEEVPAEAEPPIDARASFIEAGLGRMVGRRGDALAEAVAVMMLGSWMPVGLIEP